MISNQFISYHIKRAAKQVYWLYRLSQAQIGKGTQLEFPLIVEGKGKIEFGQKSHLQHMVNLGVWEGSFLKVGDNSLFENQSTILVAEKSNLEIGHQFKLGEKARLFVNNQWKFGNDVKIETHCAIFAREPNHFGILNIGDGTHIGDHTIIDMVADVTIGKEVAVGPNCTIYTHDHIYSDLDRPAWKGGLTKSATCIEDGAWIGSGVTILPGVTIGQRAVIAAGSVVTKSVDPNCIYAGIPAKLIKTI